LWQRLTTLRVQTNTPTPCTSAPDLIPLPAPESNIPSQTLHLLPPLPLLLLPYQPTQVRLGIHHLSRRKVAIKIIDKGKLSDPNEAKRIQREIRVLQRLSHDSVIKLFEVLDAGEGSAGDTHRAAQHTAHSPQHTAAFDLQDVDRRPRRTSKRFHYVSGTMW
jgi:hypothetical protein